MKEDLVQCHLVLCVKNLDLFYIKFMKYKNKYSVQAHITTDSIEVPVTTK